MFILHVDMLVTSGKEAELAETFRSAFRPAISIQSGFRGVHLLQPLEEGRAHRLSIAFDCRESQQRWVSTKLHQEVWPQMESKADRCTVDLYLEL